MAVSPTYPGVYVQEVPSGVRTIVGVSTSTTLFVGRTLSGPLDKPVRITTYADFARAFGEDHTVSDMARYVKLFFLNGGADAYILRIADGAIPAVVTLKNEAAADVLRLTAKNAGTQGNSIRAAVSYNTSYPEATFNMEVFRWETTSSGTRVKTDREEWLNLSMDPGSSNYAPTFLSQKSKLVNGEYVGPATLGTGSSISGRVVSDNNSLAGFQGAWSPLIGGAPGNPKNKFRISIDGNRAVEVNLGGINVNTVTAGAADGDAAAPLLATAILTAIQAALVAESISIPAPVATVTIPAQTPAGTPRTRRLVIASGHNGDIRISSAANPAEDIAGVLMLGEANGGTEPGAYGGRRPAPTGISLKAGSVADLNNFALLAQTAIDTVTLDKLDASGALVAAALDVELENLAPGAGQMFVDAAGEWRGVREKLGRIRDRVNAEQLAIPSRFFWRAEIWGNRLAFIKSSGEDAVVTAFSVGPGAGVTAYFTNNIRHYIAGPSTVHPFHTPGMGGFDGGEPGMDDYEAAYAIADREIDLFNILVLPPDRGEAATLLTELWPAASVFCQQKRAFLIMDDPDWESSQAASSGVDELRLGLVKDHAAIYFPRISIVEGGLTRNVGAAGAMAGLYARIDSNRGVWKAPAGTEADIRAVTGVDLRISDAENGQVNPVGVNAIRVFPDGVVSWGSRTMAGADVLTSEYKYVPVRRTALFIEESLYRGLKWVIFEPNDVALWAQIRLNVGAFMQDLFRKGAFAGARPSEAYFVKCDAETTTQNDRNLGIVNIWVGFAPLKPAEFVILYLQQMAGQLEAQG